MPSVCVKEHEHWRSCERLTAKQYNKNNSLKKSLICSLRKLYTDNNVDIEQNW